jgi:hypothetical protein
MARPRTYDSFTSISVQEEMAFLGYGEYLVILDISTPSQPTLMSELPLQNHIKQIQVISDTVYIVLEVSGGPDETQIELQIVDVTDPLNPFKQGVYRPAFLAVDAVVIGKVAHVIGLENYWEIVGISNPNAPNKIGTIREGYTTGYTDRCSGCTILRNIKEIEGYLHLFSLTYRYGTNPIIVYDVSNPLNPEQIGTLNDPTQKSILNVVYAHKDAYTFAPYEGVFFRILGCCWHGVVGELVLEIPETLLQAGELAVIDHYVYLASSDGFYIVDVIDRFRPSLANALYPNAYFSDIVKANGFVYLLDWNNGLIILDVSGPVNPVEVGKWQQ